MFVCPAELRLESAAYLRPKACHKYCTSATRAGVRVKELNEQPLSSWS